MDIPLNNSLVSEHYLLCMVASFCLSAYISYRTYPVIIKISKSKGLMEEPKKRSSHFIRTPNLGGIGIFLGVISTLTFVGSILSYNNLLCLIGASIFLFFTGLKDDLVDIKPISKLFGQTVASLCVIIISDIRIHSFFGIFGIETLPYLASVIFTLFVFILLINAFNLIDGVDGLAACIAIVSSTIFGVLFYSNGNDSMLFISLSVMGALSTFLIFNFSNTKKVFMGDTGSLIIGFLLAYQGISFLRMDHTLGLASTIPNIPVLMLAIFSFPLMDTLRVFIIRIMQRRSPFSADKNHIHHNLLALGLKHWQVSIICSLFVVIIVGFTYYFDGLNIHTSLIAFICVASVMAIIPYMVVKFQQKKLSQSILNSVSLKKLNKKSDQSFSFQRAYNSILNIFISLIIYLHL